MDVGADNRFSSSAVVAKYLVVLVFLAGLGWHLFQRYRKKVDRKGVASALGPEGELAYDVRRSAHILKMQMEHEAAAKKQFEKVRLLYAEAHGTPA